MQDEDFSEIDTTAAEFDAMWEAGEPVETVGPHALQADSASAAAYVRFAKVTKSWATLEDVDTESAYALHAPTG
jgi:hypothetical protein